MVALDGGGLTAADIAAVARRTASVEVTPRVRARVVAAHEFAAGVAAERPVYGRTTGVGANRTERVVDSAAHVRALLRSHATSAGPLRNPERVRAMVAVRLSQLAASGSGMSAAVLDGARRDAGRRRAAVPRRSLPLTRLTRCRRTAPWWPANSYSCARGSDAP